MKSSAKKVELASVDDLFTTEESRQDATREKIVEIPLTEHFPFEGHPFSVRDDDDAMKETVESVKEVGVVVPAIARPREGGGYELIAGHRRKRDCELAGLETMPVIIRNLDRDTAIIYMVDSNLQREIISPLEKAQAYKMKLEAIRRRSGERTDLTSAQVGQRLPNKTSREFLTENSPDSSSQIQRLIRLTELSPELQQMVNDGKISLTPAVEISYLKPEEQALLVDAMESEQTVPSLPGLADEENEPRGEIDRGHHAVRHVGAEKAGGRPHRADDRHSAQVFSEILYLEEDGGNHHRPSGELDEKAPAEPGALTPQFQIGQLLDRIILCSVFCMKKTTR